MPVLPVRRPPFAAHRSGPSPAARTGVPRRVYRDGFAAGKRQVAERDLFDAASPDHGDNFRIDEGGKLVLDLVVRHQGIHVRPMTGRRVAIDFRDAVGQAGKKTAETVAVPWVDDAATQAIAEAPDPDATASDAMTAPQLLARALADLDTAKQDRLREQNPRERRPVDPMARAAGRG